MGLVVVVLLQELRTHREQRQLSNTRPHPRARPAAHPSHPNHSPGPHLLGVGGGVALDEVLQLGQVAGQFVALAARHGCGHRHRQRTTRTFRWPPPSWPSPNGHRRGTNLCGRRAPSRRPLAAGIRRALEGHSQWGKLIKSSFLFLFFFF